DRWTGWIIVPVYAAHCVVAGLDVGRSHWSDNMGVGLQGAGLVAHAAGWALVVWAMWTNRFFSPVVRIQQERHHHLIRSGPYRYVRHPGYLGGILAFLSSSLALGSWWSMVPAGLLVFLLLRRAVLEDR